jgi:hypothetical protein
VTSDKFQYLLTLIFGAQYDHFFWAWLYEYKLRSGGVSLRLASANMLSAKKNQLVRCEKDSKEFIPYLPFLQMMVVWMFETI